MVEVQFHGFSFERWARNTFFGKYLGNYMQKWDIPASENKKEEVPIEWRNFPVSIKTAKWGSPVGLGDAIRQRNINESFVMIAGFWRQITPQEKWFKEIGVVKFHPEFWNSLWGAISLAMLREMDSKIKDLRLHYSDARKVAKQWKSQLVISGSKIVINPKIDSKKQRRIQCSLPFKIFWEAAGRKPTKRNNPMLFGKNFPNPVRSEPRRFSEY